MKDQYKEVTQLANQDRARNGATLAIHMSKLAEEVGELANAINILSGRKGTKKVTTKEKIAARKNLLEEAADCIQIIFGITSQVEFSYSDLSKELHKKNKKYRKFVHK